MHLIFHHTNSSLGLSNNDPIDASIFDLLRSLLACNAFEAVRWHVLRTKLHSCVVDLLRHHRSIDNRRGNHYIKVDRFLFNTWNNFVDEILDKLLITIALPIWNDNIPPTINNIIMSLHIGVVVVFNMTIAIDPLNSRVCKSRLLQYLFLCFFGQFCFLKLFLYKILVNFSTWQFECVL